MLQRVKLFGSVNSFSVNVIWIDIRMHRLKYKIVGVLSGSVVVFSAEALVRAPGMTRATQHA